MNKCCECAKEKICKKRSGSHRYCFMPKKKAESTKIDMLKKMIACYEKEHGSDTE